MGPVPYIPSSVLLEEHRQHVQRSMPDPDWPPAVPVRRPSRVATLRPRLGSFLRSVADRLDPAGARIRDVKLFVVPYPEDAKHDVCSRREVQP